MDVVNAVVVQKDDKIAVVGTHSNLDFVVARYNSDGSLDSGFGSNGIVTTAVSGNEYGFASAQQPDGNIVLAGWRQTGNDFVVLRFEGSLLDVTPDSFSFKDKTDVEQDRVQTSNLITVSGLGSGVSVPVSVSGGEYTLNAGMVYTSGNN